VNHDPLVAQTLRSIAALTGIPIRPDAAEEGDVAPYLVYAEIALPPDAYTLGGESSLVPARYQIDVYAATRAQANALAQAAHDALTAAFGGVAVSRQSLFEHDTRLRRTLLDLQLWFPNP
jgi:hypothetical protein